MWALLLGVLTALPLAAFYIADMIALPESRRSKIEVALILVLYTVLMTLFYMEIGL